MLIKNVDIIGSRNAKETKQPNLKQPSQRPIRNYLTGGNTTPCIEQRLEGMLKNGASPTQCKSVFKNMHVELKYKQQKRIHLPLF